MALDCLTIYTHIGYIETMEDAIIKRLKRIRGQVDGIIKMYTECRECGDVVTQIAAARAALGGVGKELLKSEAVGYVKESKGNNLDRLIKQLLNF